MHSRELLKASIIQWETFIEGPVWADMKLILETKLEAARLEMEGFSLQEWQLRQAQGMVRELRQVLLLPEITVEKLKIDKRSKEEKEQEDDS